MDHATLAAHVEAVALLEGDLTLRSGENSKFYSYKQLFETQPDVLSLRRINPTLDPLIDDVRHNRRRPVSAYDNDLDRLAAHLRRVQTDYENRTGQFADLPRHIRKEPFPAMNRQMDDRICDEIRTLRTKPHRKLRTRRKHP